MANKFTSYGKVPSRPIRRVLKFTKVRLKTDWGPIESEMILLECGHYVNPIDSIKTLHDHRLCDKCSEKKKPDISRSALDKARQEFQTSHPGITEWREAVT